MAMGLNVTLIQCKQNVILKNQEVKKGKRKSDIVFSFSVLHGHPMPYKMETKI